MPSWAPNWFKNDEDDKDKDKDKKRELPPELEERFKKVDDLDTKVSGIDKKLESLNSITAFFDEMKKEKEDAKKVAEDKKKKDSETPDEDLAAMLLSDPKKAIAEMTAPLANTILLNRADTIRRQVFDDDPQSHEFYTGEIKKEVDALISSQDLKFQNNAASLQNAYDTVVGRRYKEIQEGKIKSRFASSSSGTISDKGKKGEDMEIESTPDIIRAARLSGMELDDYKKLVKRAAQAGELEVV